MKKPVKAKIVIFPLSSFLISFLVWQAGDHVCKPRGLCGLSPPHIQEDRERKGRRVGGDRSKVPAQVTVFRIRHILGLKFGTGSSLFMTKKTAGYCQKTGSYLFKEMTCSDSLKWFENALLKSYRQIYANCKLFCFYIFFDIFVSNFFRCFFKKTI
jgi:hypothetical protein